MNQSNSNLLKNVKQEQLAFIQQLNRLRLSLRTIIEQESTQKQSEKMQSKIEIQNVLPKLLETQLLLYDNQIKTSNNNPQLQKNTVNILALTKAAEFNRRLKQKSNYKGGSISIKWNHNSNQVKVNSNCNNKTVSSTIGTVSTMVQKKTSFPPKQQVKKTIPQFVSAASMLSTSNIPKGTSLRKKFVPPFKKEQKVEFQGPHKQKQKIGKNTSGENDQQMDPRFKNLQAKLVQMIQSEIVERNSQVEWSQIAGLGFAKKIIHQMIVWPMLRPDIFTGLRAPPKSILFFGPPGTGKTMIGKAIASEAKATFFSISASSLTSKWVGQSQKLVRTLFAVARLKQPSVIFIDEIDSLLCSRKQGEQQSSRRVKTQFLVELDGAKTNSQERVLIIGATNLPQELDDAVRRRFIKRLYIPLPNLEGRKQLLTKLTNCKNQSFCLKEAQLIELSEATRGYSGADLYNLCAEAALIPLRNLVSSSIQTIRQSQVPVTKLKDFYQALQLVRPSVHDGLLQSFEEWNKMFGSYQFSPDQLQISK